MEWSKGIVVAVFYTICTQNSICDQSFFTEINKDTNLWKRLIQEFPCEVFPAFLYKESSCFLPHNKKFLPVVGFNGTHCIHCYPGSLTVTTTWAKNFTCTFYMKKGEKSLNMFLAVFTKVWICSCLSLQGWYLTTG